MFSAFVPQNGFGNWKLGYLLAFKHLHWLLAVCFGCEQCQSVVDGWVLPWITLHPSDAVMLNPFNQKLMYIHWTFLGKLGFVLSMHAAGLSSNLDASNKSKKATYLVGQKRTWTVAISWTRKSWSIPFFPIAAIYESLFLPHNNPCDSQPKFPKMCDQTDKNLEETGNWKLCKIWACKFVDAKMQCIVCQHFGFLF